LLPRSAVTQKLSAPISPFQGEEAKFAELIPAFQTSIRVASPRPVKGFGGPDLKV
jgi:hypothetical protein